MPRPQDHATITGERPHATAPSLPDPTEAAGLAARFAQVMEELLAVVEEETKLVRAGRSREAAALEQRKGDLARLYLTDAAQVKACRGTLREHAPDLLRELRHRHDLFRALLQINLAVLATAHAVAEGVVRGVSVELSQKLSPQTYTSSGRNTAATGGAPPMAGSRQL